MNSRLTVLAVGVLAACVIVALGGGCGPATKESTYAAMEPAQRLLTIEVDGPKTPGAAAALTATLESPKPLYRAEAAQTLGTWATFGDAYVIVPAITHADVLVRSMAQAAYMEHNARGRGVLLVEGNLIEVPPAVLHALTLLGDPQGIETPPEVIAPLRGELQRSLDGNQAESVLAADILSRIGDAGARRVLIRIVEAGEGPALAKAAEACVRNDMDLGPTLLPMAFSNGVLARRAVMRALVDDPDPRLKALPLKGLTDGDLAVRHNAIRAIGNLDGAAPVKELAARLSTTGEEQLDVIRGLGAIGRPAGDTLREFLRRSSIGEQAEVAALIALAPQADRDDIVWVTKRLRSSSEFVRAAALFVLGRIGNPEAQAAVMSATNDKEPLVRAAAARALGQLSTIYAARKLVTMLDDPSSRVRSMSAWGLGRATYAEAVPALKKLIAQSQGAAESVPSRVGEPYGWPELAAVEALGRIGTPDAVAILLDTLDAKSWLMRAAAAKALGAAGKATPQTVKALEKHLRDPVSLVRAEALISLQAFGKAYDTDLLKTQ